MEDTNSNESQPIYIRVPRQNIKCPKTGLTRAYLNKLILPCKENNYDPPVKSVSACKKGKTKGVRLILLTSLLNYLESINKTNKNGGNKNAKLDK